MELRYRLPPVGVVPTLTRVSQVITVQNVVMLIGLTVVSQSSMSLYGGGIFVFNGMFCGI